MVEIELTYLAKSLPKGVFVSPSKEILDVYLPQSVEHPVLRIRMVGNRYEMTKKEPLSSKDNSRQLETTIPLTKNEFDEFEKNIKGKRVRKVRYYYKEKGVNYEVGIFKDNLAGLVLVDIEFNSKNEKNLFKAPEWLLTDVTQEKFTAGGMLCGKNYKDIEGKLAKFGYKKLNC